MSPALVDRNAQSWSNSSERPDPRLKPVVPPEQRVQAIGDVAKEFSITLRALRFYEDKGLITPLRQGTTRLYRPEDRRKLALILNGKKLGFTLKQIRALLASDGQAEDGLSRTGAFEQTLTREQVTTQLSALERQRTELDAAIGRLQIAHAAMAASND